MEQDKIKEFLVSIRVPVQGNRLLEILENLGVECIEDLRDVSQEDLVDSGQYFYIDIIIIIIIICRYFFSLGLSVIVQRRLIRSIREMLYSSASAFTEDSPLTSLRSFPDDVGTLPIPTSFESAPTPTVEEHYVPPALKQKRSKMYYIFCKDLFGRNVMREVITNLDLEHDSLEFIARMISERHKFRLDTYAIEFYSHEGYPMCVNQYNVKCK